MAVNHKKNGFRGSNNSRQKVSQNQRSLKRKREADDLAALTESVESLDSKPDAPYEAFDQLPLSSVTSSGLNASHFKTLTAIQSRAIPVALKSNDVLGAAKTGSGKTLAFLIPVLENLYRRRWTEYDGLGALILSPTRELAIQIFEVLRKVGRNHTFSAGLVIGGKSLEEERARLGRMNILVATPGRMLQHMDQTAEFDIGELQMLVLDEADRIMDMGFQNTVDAIIDHLPKSRQTLMFSATQTKKVSDLARLSLKNPEFVAVHESADSATPSTLQQNYVVTPLPEKLDTLWSFLRSNLKSKTLVFLSSGKQVRFVYEAFRHLQPGISLLHLHGRQRQTARLDITTRFSRTEHCVLFSTDVAARGLDFPAVDWVVQLDAPEDADTYIHRVGRTARYNRAGRAVLFVDPSEEEGMMNALFRKKVTLEVINVRAKKKSSIRSQLQNMCFKDPELKYLGQKAFISYTKSIHLQKDKDIFDVRKLALDEFAASLGLPGAPRVKFVKGDDAKSRKNAPRQLLEASDSEDDSEDAKTGPNAKNSVRTKYDRMFERQNQDILSKHYQKMVDENGELEDSTVGHGSEGIDGTENDGFLDVKRRFTAGDARLGSDPEQDDGISETERSESDLQKATSPSRANGSRRGNQEIKKVQLSSNAGDAPLNIDSHRREKLLKSKKALLKFKGKGSHFHYGDDDVPREAEYYEREEEFEKKGKPEEQRRKFLEEEAQRVREQDIGDKAIAKQKRKAKLEKRRERERVEKNGGAHAVLAPADNEIGVDLDTLDYNEGLDSSDHDARKQEAEIRPNKKKKWFQDALSGNEESVPKPKRHQKQQMEEIDIGHQPDSLEDLETMAKGLLAR
ncbi:MAG: hypothetical protein Q9227_006782 [Pyrenula ochraceoflavens]